MDDGQEPRHFREAMARYPSGVTVVTMRDASGTPWGFTASAFVSLSMVPPLVLVCLSCSAQCAQAFGGAGAFAVSILRPEHREIALRFASRGADKFAGAPFTDGALGQPVLHGSLAGVECRLEERYPGGDHTILVGRVQRAWAHDGEPMVYFAREFHQLAGAGGAALLSVGS